MAPLTMIEIARAWAATVPYARMCDFVISNFRAKNGIITLVTDHEVVQSKKGDEKFDRLISVPGSEGEV